MTNLTNAFLSHVPFMVELWIGIAAFIAPLSKRNHMFRRCACAIAAAGILSFLTLPYSTELVVYFAVSALFVYCFCKTSLRNAIYCTACGYAIQHTSYAMRMVLYIVVGKSIRSGMLTLGQQLLGVLFASVCSIAAYFLLVRKMTDKQQYEISTRQSLTSTLLVILIVEVFSVASASAYASGMESLYLVCNLYDAFCCLFFLWNQASWVRRSQLERQLAFQQAMEEQRAEQFALTRENIDIINRKCHDLKHQMAALQTVVPEAQRKAYCEEVQNAIQIYDSSLNTGSNVLDTILTDKSLYCEAHQINMTCVADGHSLSFLNSLDLYAIFGNALDNAIRAAAALDDPEKRFISVSVWEKNGLVLFQFENYYEGTLEFDGALPKTTKDSSGSHGYGLKSIQQTAQKYGGQMTLHTDNNLFLLRVSIPVPTEAGDASAPA